MRAWMGSGVVGLTVLSAGCGRTNCDTSQPADVSLEFIVDAAAPPLETPVTVELRDEAGVIVDTVSEDTTWEQLPGGTYRFTVVRGFTEVVAGLRDAVGHLDAPVWEQCVGGEPVVVPVDVARQPGSGQLWASSWEHLLVYPANAANATASPVTDLTFELSNALGAVTADRSGSLWAATGWTYGARLVGVPPGDVTGTGPAAPWVEVVSTGFLLENALFTGLRFDGEGNAWAITAPQMGGFVGIVGWSRDTMERAWLTGGTVEAMPDFVVDGTAVDGFSDLWIAENGDLWATAPTSSEIVHYTAASVRTGSADAPAIVEPAERLVLVDDADQAWPGVDALAPDGSGGFYAMAWTSGTLVHATAAAITAATDGKVVATPALPLGVTALPETLSADAAGGVWWLDTGKLGHRAADGTVSTVEVPTLERPGAAHLDIGG